MRQANFKLESLGYETFEGFTRDEEWNGWGCPYFTFEQAQKILKSSNQLRAVIGQNPAFYDSAIDAFVFPLSDDEFETFTPFFENDQKYYPIGTFNWIWEEIYEK